MSQQPGNTLLNYLRKVPLTLPASPGEYYDRLTILRVKLRNSKQLPAAAQDQIRAQIETLEIPLLSLYSDPVPLELTALVRNLTNVNSLLWMVEDDIRALDKEVFPLTDATRDSLERFAVLAREIYVLNTRRHELKRAIDQMCGRATEVKHYAQFK